MGFWDYKLASLEAIGTRFSPEEEAILENGGQLAVIRVLSAPEAFEYEEDARDRQGDLVFVMDKVTAVAPNALYLPYWNKGNGERGMTAAEKMDREYGDDWTTYPSYLGVLEDGLDDPWIQYRCDDLNFYRFWSCRPLLTEADYAIVDRLLKACQQRIHSSLYMEAREYVVDASSGEYDPEDFWMAARHSELLTQEDRDEIAEQASEVFGDNWQMVDAANGFQALVDARWLNPGHPALSYPKSESLDMDYKSMEEILEQDPEALQFWQSMIYRRRTRIERCLSSIPPKMQASARYKENQYL